MKYPYSPALVQAGLDAAPVFKHLTSVEYQRARKHWNRKLDFYLAFFPVDEKYRYTPSNDRFMIAIVRYLNKLHRRQFPL